MILHHKLLPFDACNIFVFSCHETDKFSVTAYLYRRRSLHLETLQIQLILFKPVKIQDAYR